MGTERGNLIEGIKYLNVSLDLAKARFKNLPIIYSRSVPSDKIHATYMNTNIYQNI